MYPGDHRKINSIEENVKCGYHLIELDLCKDSITKSYDLVLAHLLLGEATKFGNDFKVLLEKLLKIDSKYFIIYDFLEDNTIDYKYLESFCLMNHFEILDNRIFKKKEEQEFKEFIGKNYKSYVLKKLDKEV